MEKTGAFGGIDVDDIVFIPTTTAMRQFNMEHIQSLWVQSESPETIPQTREEIERILSKTLKKADTTGVFQLESSGMRRYLKELEPSELEDIVAMVALYRPGPMELIPQYIARKHKKEATTFFNFFRSIVTCCWNNHLYSV